MWYERILALDVVPDGLLRRAIRMRLGRHHASLERDFGSDPQAAMRRFADELRQQPIAVHTDAANEQHYEVPAGFFSQFLGPRMKYSSCYWPAGVDDLAAAEDAMLALSCERAGITEGMEILDLGCGWGSLSLYVAERYPGTRVLAVSNSGSQGEYIREEAARRGITNVEHEVGNVAEFDTKRRFDRVVSIEMLEHVRNYELAFRNIRRWLAPGGRCFVHVFSHRRYAYTFEGDDWMGRYFFTGGTMPAHDLFREFDADLEVAADWHMDGQHYARTLEAWLERLDAVREPVWPVLVDTYGQADARRWWVNWRLFFIVCAESFALDGGQQYGVSHYLFESVARPTG
ncbi:MAG: cyclopropane-fatty-acyl-phospholipid synthase family protein [Chloroflexota bacterium]|jgi:cyclopropane-fatty-acyl-phospholipid synthase